MIQAAFGWTDSHLHEFKADGFTFTMVYEDQDNDPNDMHEVGVKLSAILNREGGSIVYNYDFGDAWLHTITLEAIISSPIALCVDAARACPPEDCGGVNGYEQLVSTLSNAKHHQHGGYVEWVPRGFKPEAFGVARANTRIREWVPLLQRLDKDDVDY